MIILVILILIFLNAYFSLAEIALIAVKEHELKKEIDSGNIAAQKVKILIKDPESFLSVVQVGITLLGIIEGIYGGKFVAEMIDPFVSRHFNLSPVMLRVITTCFGIGLITYLTIIIGELLPKSIALQSPLKVSLWVAPSLVLFSRIAFPFVKLLTLNTRFLLNLLNIHKGENQKITESDLKNMLSTAYRQGILKEEELVLHQNIFTYDELIAEQIMKPAVIVEVISYSASRIKVTDFIKRKPYSHFPVLDEKTGKITGVLTIKDFFLEINIPWQNLIRSPFIITPETLVKDIFLAFKEKNHDFGLVMEKQTEFLGIITMQDVMEGVFGDMPEREDYHKYFYKLNDNTWIANSFIHLQRIRRELSLEWMREYEMKYITIAELFSGLLHQSFKVGDQLKLYNVVFTIMELEADSIKKIKIELLPVP
ncbi:hypothetical protein CMU49_13875 [Elizabethkingia anophelis]|nr:hypothetical protein [Elizabethkingia anophelis]